MNHNVTNIIFDLDDTLFDTWGQLAKPAHQEACQAMIKAGLDTSLEDCLKIRLEARGLGARGNIFKKMVTVFKIRDSASAEEIAEIGETAFHKREIKEKIALFPDTKETLARLKKKYTLHLVTWGDPKTQEKKVKLLEIADFFSMIIYVDGKKEKNKKKAFEHILKLQDTLPGEFLSIGNRIDMDIKYAKELGMKSVLFSHGEYLNLKPESKMEEPDFQVQNLGEFEKWLNS